MADGIRIATKGFSDLQRELAKFGPRVENRARKKGLREVSKNLRRHFRSKAPEGATGLLRKSIRFRVARRSARAWIGLRTNFYYKTLEFGRAAHERRSGPVSATGPMRPWFRDAWLQVQGRTRSKLQREFKQALYTEARKEYQRSKRRLARRTLRRITRG